jgi:1-acyl-sn-glycerol-3-phosphate acyltransferase
LDSMLVGLLFMFYPFYLLFLSLLTYRFTQGFWGFTVFLIMPFLAWSYVQLKD